MKIIKFGGILFSNEADLELAFKNLISVKSDCFIIISAFGKISSKLKSLSEKILHTKAAELEKEFKELFLPFQVNIDEAPYDYYLDMFKKIIDGFELTGVKTPAASDKLIGLGDKISARIFYEKYKIRQPDIQHIEPEDLIVTNSQFGDADPNFVETINKIKAEGSKGNSIVTAGFVGADKFGRTTTMGFENSNLSAVLIAIALNINMNLIVFILFTNIKVKFKSYKILIIPG